jgi:hypothetical protein
MSKISKIIKNVKNDQKPHLYSGNIGKNTLHGTKMVHKAG